MATTFQFGPSKYRVNFLPDGKPYGFRRWVKPFKVKAAFGLVSRANEEMGGYWARVSNPSATLIAAAKAANEGSK